MKKGFILPLVFIILAAGAFYLFTTRNTDNPTTKHTPTSTNSTRNPPITAASSSPTEKNPLPTPVQEQTLEKLGIDPASLPKTLTPAMITCAREKLGTERANELINGS